MKVSHLNTERFLCTAFFMFEIESEIGRSLACDGVFLYTTNSQGKNLAKIGSGLHGTLR